MKSKIILLMLCSVIISAAGYGQKNDKKSRKMITVSGYVNDQTLKPVANAIVLVEGNKTPVITDRKGFFKLKIKPEIKKIGILTATNGMLEEEVNGRTRINFSFAGSVPDQAFPGEVLPGDEEINVGYATVKKRNLTTPVNQVDVANSRYASYRTVYEVLRGEVPGVQVSGNSIRIQGATSLTLSTEPLFVVDGVPVNSVEDIQPVMIKSIQVLKGSDKVQ